MSHVLISKQIMVTLLGQVCVALPSLELGGLGGWGVPCMNQMDQEKGVGG